jgi:DNA recombination protein RmuC
MGRVNVFEVWDVLTEVKTEFTTISSVIEQVQKQLNTASGTMEKLRTTRSNVLERKLKKVELLDNKQSTLPMDES